jgi:glucokinase
MHTVLGGDLGGTKVLLGLFSVDGTQCAATCSRSFPSADYGDLPSIVRAFLGPDCPGIDAAVIGVAGPVTGGRARLTNLPWTVDADDLRTLLGTPSVEVINDIQATAYGVLTLPDTAFTQLSGSTPRAGSAAVIAAGTGLGQAGLYWDGHAHHVVASEGGHADFAPRTVLEAALCDHLRHRFGHASYERVLSGPGLVNIYEFLRDTGRGEEPPDLARRLEAHDPAAVISELALAGTAPICTQALDLFVSIYGAEAGNLALKFYAIGGVFVAGGIAPKIESKLRDGTFVAAFRDKGRMAALMETIPVRIVLEPRAGLAGAAYRAGQLAREGDAS